MRGQLPRISDAINAAVRSGRTHPDLDALIAWHAVALTAKDRRPSAENRLHLGIQSTRGDNAAKRISLITDLNVQSRGPCDHMSGLGTSTMKEHPGHRARLCASLEHTSCRFNESARASITCRLLVRAHNCRTWPPRGRMGCATTTLCRGQAECRSKIRTLPGPAPPRRRAPIPSVQSGWHWRRAIRAFAEPSAKAASRSRSLVKAPTICRALYWKIGSHSGFARPCPRPAPCLTMTPAMCALPVQLQSRRSGLPSFNVLHGGAGLGYQIARP